MPTAFGDADNVEERIPSSKARHPEQAMQLRLTKQTNGSSSATTMAEPEVDRAVNLLWQASLIVVLKRAPGFIATNKSCIRFLLKSDKSD